MKITCVCIFILTLFACNNNSSNEQVKDIEPMNQTVGNEINLAPYSYLLGLFKNGNPDGNATGFFVKYNHRLYLISNYHIFASQNTARKQKAELQIDSLQFVYNKSLETKGVISVNLIKIRDKSKSYYFFEHPDIFVYDVTNKIPEGSLIYSIEDFITPTFRVGKPTDIYAFGYPDIVHEGANPEQMHFQLSDIPFDTGRFLYGDEHIPVVLTNSFILNHQSKGGMSGSPLFFEYKSDHKDSVVFGGVVSTHLGESDKTIVVKPSQLLKLLEEASNSVSE